MKKEMVCKYCGSKNVVVQGKTTKYYYCNDCDSPTDLISEREWERLNKDINMDNWGCIALTVIFMLPLILGAVALLILALK